MTAQDRQDWEQWRRERKRQQQRDRRAKYSRIDYYPDKLAAELIERRWSWRPGCDLSGVINRIISDWAEMRERLPPE